MPRITMVSGILLAAGLTAGLAACEGQSDAAGEVDTVQSSDMAPSPDTVPSSDTTLAGPEPGATGEAHSPPPADLRGYDTVFVYFDGPTPDGVTMGPLVPRARAVPDTGAMTYALAELVAGPTAADTVAVGTPLYSWFSGETAGMLRGVGLENDVAVVEFDDFRSIIPGASSSAGSTALLRQLKATVFQFPEVRRVEFRIDGSCEAFMAWLQIGCVPIPRSSFTEPEGYRVAVPAESVNLPGR